MEDIDNVLLLVQITIKKDGHKFKLETSVAGIGLDMFDRTAVNSSAPTKVLYLYLSPFWEQDISDAGLILQGVIQGHGMKRKKKEKVWYYAQLNQQSRLEILSKYQEIKNLLSPNH